MILALNRKLLPNREFIHAQEKSLPQTQCEKLKNILSQKHSSKQLFSNFFCATVDFTRFLPKPCESNHIVEITEIYCHWKNISWNQLFSNFYSENVTFTKFLSKKCHSKFLQFPLWLNKFPYSTVSNYQFSNFES